MGRYLQQMMDAAQAENPDRKSLFYWLKTAPARPSFADVVFGCRNKIFAIIAARVVERPAKEGGIDLAVTVDAERRDLLIRESIQNGIVPAMFPMWPDTLRPLHGDWNLMALPEGGLFNPLAAAGEEAVPLSAWELNRLAVQTVAANLREMKRRILSSQDMTGFYPQIWFEDIGGGQAWAVAFPDVTPDWSAPVPTAAADLAVRLFPAGGYTARVGIRCAGSRLSVPYRGTRLMLAFEGLQAV